jgi:hypothetical protein
VISRSLLVKIVLIVFLAYILQLRWNAYDVQTFVEYYKDAEYGGLLVPRVIAVPLLSLGFCVFLPSLIGAARLLPWPLGVLLLIGLASATWTISLNQTIGQEIDLLMTSAVAVLSIRVLGAQATLTTTWQFSVAILVASVALAASGTTYAINIIPHYGDWRGIFQHKNEFGAFVLILWVITIFGREWLLVGRLARTVVLLLCAAALIGSGAKTDSLLAVATWAVYVVNYTVLQKVRLLIGFLALLVALCALLAFLNQPQQTFDPQGEVTLTGRTQLWAGALPISLETPLGFGLGTSGGERVLTAMVASSGWHDVRSPHSSYIQMALDVGWPATILCVGWLASMMTLIRKRGDLMAGGLAALAACHFGIGLTETSIGAIYGSFSLFALVTVAAALNRRDRPMGGRVLSSGQLDAAAVSVGIGRRQRPLPSTLSPGGLVPSEVGLPWSSVQ